MPIWNQWEAIGYPMRRIVDFSYRETNGEGFVLFAPIHKVSERPQALTLIKFVNPPKATERKWAKIFPAGEVRPGCSHCFVNQSEYLWARAPCSAYFWVGALQVSWTFQHWQGHAACSRWLICRTRILKASKVLLKSDNIPVGEDESNHFKLGKFRRAI